MKRFSGAILAGSGGLPVSSEVVEKLPSLILDIGAALHITGSLVIGYIGVPYFNGQVDIHDGGGEHDPEVWVLNSLKIEEEGDHTQEALFSNLNAKMRIECDGNSLVGRFEAKRGVARKIEVEPPLHLVEGNKLMLAPAEGVQGQLDSLQAQINDLKSLVNGASNSLQNQIYAMTGGAEGVSLQSLLELVNSLQDQIDHIVSGSTQTLATLNTKINSEITNRGNADAAIAVPVNRLIDGVIYWCATQASYTTGEAGPLLLVNLGAPWPPAKL